MEVDVAATEDAGMRKVTIAVLLAAALTTAGTVGADEKTEAKQYFDAGVALLKVEDYRGAASSFEASLATYPTKTAQFNLANCYKALQRYDEALAALFRLRSDFAGKLSAEMAAEAAAIENEIRLIVGTLYVEVDRHGATVLVGGQEVGSSPLSKPVVLSPGDYEVTARLQGVEYGVGRVRMLPGKTQTMKLVGVGGQDTGPIPTATLIAENPKQQEQPPESARAGTDPGKQRLPGSFWAFTAIGAVGLIGGGVSWGVFSHNRNLEEEYASTLEASRFDDYSWEDNCAAGKVFYGTDDEKSFCDTEWARRDSEDKAKVALAIAIPSTAVFVIGGTLAIIFFSKSKKSSAASDPVAVFVSPIATEDRSGLVLMGSF